MRVGLPVGKKTALISLKGFCTTMPTSDLMIEQLPTPQPCELCGRPTTRYSPELDLPYCGREERPPEWQRREEFAPAMRGDHGGRARRGMRRRRRVSGQ